MLRTTLAAAALASVALIGVVAARAEGPARRLPLPAVASAAPTSGLRTAVFSGGCFWGVEGVFSHVHGVKRAVSGYTGGQAATASYDDVATGQTGHAESVQVTYDPRQVSYGQLLQVFFSVALDPTEVNRQGPDDGSQYRSMLWTDDATQQRVAGAYLHQLSLTHAFAAPIATKIEPLHGFYPAEAFHQDFMARNPDYPYIQAYDVQKVAALKALFPSLYQAKPVLSG